ncbi:MAG: Nucleoside triphosphate pyrophosphohydrolase [Syntrophaceae bacterium PtaU1.Bin231]|nr:MAG: Nucleoside triphosphate pyrophosphohydrolase [Syntrophaceae bacterium PtaU1.Bin231]
MDKAESSSLYDIDALAAIIRRLRSPEGCPWDREQRKEDLARYLLEEAYEVVDAIRSGRPEALKEELGDLLFQILFLVRLAEEASEFSLADVTTAVGAKMVRRHPHVYGQVRVNGVADVKANWQDIKERVEGKPAGRQGALEGVPRALPALARAQRIGEAAAGVGFDWEDAGGVLKKIDEEMAELRAALATAEGARIDEEIGDLLFSIVNLCRFAKVDAEQSLTGAVKKFIERFRRVEERLRRENLSPAEATPRRMDDLWNEVKQEEQR